MPSSMRLTILTVDEVLQPSNHNEWGQTTVGTKCNMQIQFDYLECMMYMRMDDLQSISAGGRQLDAAFVGS